MGTILVCAVTGIACFGAGTVFGVASILAMPLESIASIKEELRARRHGGFNYDHN